MRSSIKDWLGRPGPSGSGQIAVDFEMLVMALTGYDECPGLPLVIGNTEEDISSGVNGITLTASLETWVSQVPEL